MAAIVHAFPANRIVRRPSAMTARMTGAELAVLRQCWPSGWHEPMVDYDGVLFDRWVVPFDCAFDLPPNAIIALQPSGSWARQDAFGRVIKVGRSLADVV